MSRGTGNPISQPATRMAFRPKRSLKRPAKRLARAFTMPKLAIKDRIAALDATPNWLSARIGSTTRSMPTMAPTKALMRTSKENWCKFSLIPRRTIRSKEEALDGTAVRSGFQVSKILLGENARFVQPHNFGVIRRRRWNPAENLDD